MEGLIVGAVVGGIVCAVGGIWILITAFRESTSQGLLCFVPFYVVYYAITRWSKLKKPFIIGLVGVVVLIGGLAGGLTQFKSEAEPVISEFMEAGAAKNMEAAYTCFSSQSASKEEIAEFINDNYDLFAGYERVTTSSWEVQSSAGVTEGYTAGAIIYTDDTRMPFEAWLVKENDVWKLTGFSFG